MLPMAADLYGDLIDEGSQAWHNILPGSAVVTAATLAAAYLADRYGVPLTLMSLLVGLSLNFLGNDPRLTTGFAMASGRLLRIGIILLGARVTLAQVVGIGPLALFGIVLIVSVTILSGVWTAKLLGHRAPFFGILAGSAVAICGASAALAVAAILGERRIDKTQLTQVLLGIAAMSATAMFLYPILAHFIHFNDRQAGFLLGAAIHDVAQAIGAGYSFSTLAGETAAIVKLSRVALLAPVLMIISYKYLQPDRALRVSAFPGFVGGFFLMAAANSFGLLAGVRHYTDFAATMLLAAGVAATGIRAPMSALSAASARPLLVIIVASLVALLLSLGVASMGMG
jgi:uncharacterized integral membrane protein (TIGR00698 family)